MLEPLGLQLSVVFPDEVIRHPNRSDRAGCSASGSASRRGRADKRVA
jgi:hypothetical protein